MTLLSKAEILARDDLPSEDVHVSAWGGEVRVRGMTVRDRDAFEASLQKRGGTKHNGSKPPEQTTELDLTNFRAKLVVRCVVDEAGKRLFSDEDAEQLGLKSAAAVSKLAEVAQRLNGMTAQDVEELTGNSEATPDAGSSSASRSRSAGQSPN